MNQTARPISPSTYISIVRQKPFALYFGIVFTLLPIFMIVLFTSFQEFEGPPTGNRKKLLKKGKLIKGIIVAKDTVYNVTDNGRHPIDVRYSYQIQERTKTSSMRTLSLYKLNRMYIGDTVEVAYLRDQSTLIKLEPYSLSSTLFTVFPLVFLAIGLLFLYNVLFHTIRIIQLYRYGKVKTAQIVTMEAESQMMSFSNKSRFKIHYVYKSEIDYEIFGSSSSSDLSIVNQKRQGDDIPIFVLPTDDKISCLVDQIEAKRNKWDL